LGRCSWPGAAKLRLTPHRMFHIPTALEPQSNSLCDMRSHTSIPLGTYHQKVNLLFAVHLQMVDTVANYSTSCKHDGVRAKSTRGAPARMYEGGRKQCASLVYSGSRGRWIVRTHAHLCRWSVGKTDSMRRNFEGGGGGGMNAKYSGRVLGPASVVGSGEWRCVCAGAYCAQCASA
jgi:hypothetical protein